MDGKFVLVFTLVLAVASSQKLFFKSNRLLHKDLQQYKQNHAKQMKGFGFKEPKKYFQSPPKSQEVVPQVSADVVVCPGNKSACPIGNTCCMTATMAYGCCPLPMAMCCLDRRHCCPARTKCDLSKQACISGELVMPWYEKTQAISLENNSKKEESVICPDGQMMCADGQTCCKSPQGYSCCPLPNVVHAKSIICPDGEHQCADGQTCCRSREGYSCCPTPNAVCCSDEVHCCPTGTKCDLPHSRCVKAGTGEFFSWLEKKPMKKVMNQSDGSKLFQITIAVPIAEIGSVRCDAIHDCPTGNTCCKMQDNAWGCCPKPEAVCCSDNVHCCPSGTTCDVSSGKCNRENIQMDWFVKTPATEVEMVKCDSTHECPNGNTCCKLASGQWGCCPLPEAVCCSDNVHCCPSGTTCDVSSGKCNRENIQMDWLVKTPAKEVEMVKCDSTHECPNGNTCCKLASGQWGCCPLPEAVCCSDNVHCCPSGTTCDVSSGKCNRENIQMDWFVKTPAKEVEMVKCDSTHECPNGNTCCKLASGQWGCCPLPEAVCCSDNVHCCPSGTTCDVSSGKCNRGNIQMDWFVKTPAKEIEMVKCDSTHECPNGNTCCKLASGQWGCCPLPEAVCCSDNVHCCPSGTTCDVSSGKCNRENIQMDWLVKTPAKEVEMVKCDSTHECPNGNTCCKLASGQWGCCPLPEAVCCSDNVHCCPSGTTCDVSSGKCNRENIQMDWFVKTPAKEVEMVKCDSTHECPNGNTCCKLASGQWGCCPLPEAVCCSDNVHCCPSGTTCDVSSGKCNRGNIQMDWFVKTPAKEIEMVKCDSTHECPNGNTCCKLASGQWGCCPLPEAVCCSDNVHCCPSGTTCDVSSGKCNRENIQMDWLVKTPAKEVEMVKCDSTHECPNGNTCCKLASGQWGCCPLPEAVCCSDNVHCCPSGTTCDVSSGKCNRENIQMDWFVKTPAKEVEMVKCDSTHECPNGNTCCKLASGQWGCCPLPEAVCCSDNVHCCPSGTTCDVSSGKCNRGNIQMDWFVKTPAKEIEMVKCDSTHECPNGNTCCKLASGQWGCCPLPEAVCCSDNVHCCPSGTTCDVSSGKCNRENLQMDWFVKTPAKEVEMVKCDSTHECPNGNTCCKLSSGQWGCCPLPEAVCCNDGVHCCPSGTVCDVKTGKCNRGDIQMHWFPKEAAMINMKDVICPDGSECQDGQTCCEMVNGITSYGCCPLPNAVCCDDGQHCCPHGYKCNLSGGVCVQGYLKLPLFRTWKKNELTGNEDKGDTRMTHNIAQIKDSVYGIRESKTDLHEPYVQCSDSVRCPDGNSCCENGQGGFYCCPMPDGVCCDDHKNCCPKGYICDVGPGICRIPETDRTASHFISKIKTQKSIPLS